MCLLLRLLLLLFFVVAVVFVAVVVVVAVAVVVVVYFVLFAVVLLLLMVVVGCCWWLLLCIVVVVGGGGCGVVLGVTIRITVVTLITIVSACDIKIWTNWPTADKLFFTGTLLVIPSICRPFMVYLETVLILPQFPIPIMVVWLLFWRGPPLGEIPKASVRPRPSTLLCLVCSPDPKMCFLVPLIYF